MAIIGEVACLFAAIVALPAIILWRPRPPEPPRPSDNQGPPPA